MPASNLWHLVCGEYPPAGAGVADYAEQLSAGLAAAGAEVHVHGPAPLAQTAGVAVHPLPDLFGSSTCRALADAFRRRPGTVLVQYVPNALGRRGMNVGFCRWLRQQRETGVDVRVMFHEPYFYFGWRRPWRNLLAVVQRRMARDLLRACTEAYLSTATWRGYLEPWAPPGLSMTVLPIPSAIPRVTEDARLRSWRARLPSSAAKLAGHFGTFGADVARELAPVIPLLLARHESLVFVCAGDRGDRFAGEIVAARPDLRGRLIATGRLDAADTSAVLQSCDLLVQPYPDGITTRRTSAMAGLANGVAVVSTTGALTEDVWHDTGAVALAEAGNAGQIAAMTSALLTEGDARRSLALRGRDTYAREFALEVTLQRLMDASAVRASA